MHDLERRARAVRATLAHWEGRPFSYGTVDCVKVGAWHLRQMGHHQGLGLERAGTYRTAVGARRALTRAGFTSIADALNAAGFAPIAPASALPGDIVIANGTDDWESVGVVIGNGAIAGFHHDDMAKGVQVIRLNEAADYAVWRA